MYFKNYLLTFAIQTVIIFNHIRSVGRHGLSIKPVDFTLPAPVFRPNPTQDCLPATLTRHSEQFPISNLNSIIFFLLVTAIGLLVPRPYLIVKLL